MGERPSGDGDEARTRGATEQQPQARCSPSDEQNTPPYQHLPNKGIVRYGTGPDGTSNLHQLLDEGSGGAKSRGLLGFKAGFRMQLKGFSEAAGSRRTEQGLALRVRGKNHDSQRRAREGFRSTALEAARFASHENPTRIETIRSQSLSSLYE